MCPPLRAVTPNNENSKKTIGKTIKSLYVLTPQNKKKVIFRKRENLLKYGREEHAILLCDAPTVIICLIAYQVWHNSC